MQAAGNTHFYYNVHRHHTVLLAHHITKVSLWTETHHYQENKEMSPGKANKKTMLM